jgi:hypothetical protein
MAGSPKDTTTSSSSSAMASTAAQITGHKADLFLGTCIYQPCQHEFAWILDYPISRTGHRALAAHECPKCAENPTCAVCLERFDANDKDACSSCEQFFNAQLLGERKEKLEGINLKLTEEKSIVYLKAQIKREKQRFRETWGVEPGNTTGAGLGTESGENECKEEKVGESKEGEGHE